MEGTGLQKSILNNFYLQIQLIAEELMVSVINGWNINYNNW